MPDHPTAYLVPFASQRSGSTLLVESLRATGVQNRGTSSTGHHQPVLQPQWLADGDESDPQPADPFDE